MLHLLVRAGTRRLALEARSVVEVVPLLEIAPLPGAPPPVRGLFRYRGRPVVAVDAARLAGEGSPPERMSGRIVVVSIPGTGEASLLVGLVVTAVTDVMAAKDVADRTAVSAVTGGAAAAPHRPEEGAEPWVSALLGEGPEAAGVLRLEAFLPGAVRALIEAREGAGPAPSGDARTHAAAGESA